MIHAVSKLFTFSGENKNLDTVIFQLYHDSCVKEKLPENTFKMYISVRYNGNIVSSSFQVQQVFCPDLGPHIKVSKSKLEVQSTESHL